MIKEILTPPKGIPLTAGEHTKSGQHPIVPVVCRQNSASSPHSRLVRLEGRMMEADAMAAKRLTVTAKTTEEVNFIANLLDRCYKGHDISRRSQKVEKVALTCTDWRLGLRDVEVEYLEPILYAQTSDIAAETPFDNFTAVVLTAA